MKFVKMQGAGNDYVYVDCTGNQLDNASSIAVKVSDRHFGIGSDGLILIKNSQVADFFMEMYNADGSQSQMCGNGIRCVGKFVYDFGLTDKTEVAVETLAGIKYLTLHPGDDGKIKTVTVDMGAPELDAAKVPADISCFSEGSKNIVADETLAGGAATPNAIIAKKLNVNGEDYEVTCVSMGNPHSIVYIDKEINIKEFDLDAVGPYFENHKAFPERVNAEFIQVVDESNLNMRVWERGSAETWACGTGACASLVATVLNGLCNEEATLHLLGGDLRIRWDRVKNTVFMEGPAETVFEGEIEL
ncbi:MAG: diaminopimelate epimerase [Lachnospira sp.]|nr:diaminopimelate epimerase [Lachnospira sp.]